LGFFAGASGFFETTGLFLFGGAEGGASGGLGVVGGGAGGTTGRARGALVLGAGAMYFGGGVSGFVGGFFLTTGEVCSFLGGRSGIFFFSLTLGVGLTGDAGVFGTTGVGGVG